MQAAGPEVEETLKWNMPHFDYKGMMCGMAAFEKFPPSHRKEYIEWLTEAKRDETREKRLATKLEWLADGKPRNWKYQDC